MKKLIPVTLLSLSIAATITGCAGSNRHIYKTDGTIIQNEAKIALLDQPECIVPGGCPNEAAKLYTSTLKARLEEKLQRPVVIVPMPAQFDFSNAKVAELGKTAGVDYVIGGSLESYNDPSTFRRVLSLNSLVVPEADQRPHVKATIDIVRVADAKTIGRWEAYKSTFITGSCTSLTKDIADEVVEKQFPPR